MPDELLGDGWGAVASGGNQLPVTFEPVELPDNWNYNADNHIEVWDAQTLIPVAYSIGESAVFIRQRLRQSRCQATDVVDQWIEETSRIQAQSLVGGPPKRHKECLILKTTLKTLGCDRDIAMGDALEILRDQHFDLSFAWPVVYWRMQYTAQPIGECVLVCSDPLYAYVNGASQSFHLKICNFAGRRMIEHVPYNPARKLRQDQPVVVGVQDFPGDTLEEIAAATREKPFRCKWWK